MASIVAYIDVREGAITPPSLFAVGESRRIAQAAGATVYAFLPVGLLSHAEIDRLAEQITDAGADRVLCSSDEALAGPPLDITYGAVLSQLADHLRPLIFFFPAGDVGAELGPPLAIRIGASYVPGASVDVHVLDRAPDPPANRVLVTRSRAAGDSLRRIDVGDLERPVVAVLLQAGMASLGLGDPRAEVEMLPYPTGRQPECKLVRAEPDPQAKAGSCTTLICVPAETADADLDALRAELPPECGLRTEADPDLRRFVPEVFLWMGPARDCPGVRADSVQCVSGTAAELAQSLRRLRIAGKESSK